jgi:hypothetical protein
MIDAEPLLPLLAAIQKTEEPRYELVRALNAMPSPTNEDFSRFLADYQIASTTWANACAVLVDQLKSQISNVSTDR